MSQKRKHTEISEGDATRSGPKKQRSFKPGGSNPDKKRRRPQVSQDIEKGTSTNALKSRIRDLKRLLAHVDNVGDHKMSASTRIERERELEACEHELAEKVESNREAAYKQKMISKYHQVRFFDRQKASRILKKLKKEHDSEEDSVRKHELRMRVHNAEVDVNYAIHYPLMKPYSSLYPKQKKAKSEEAQQDEDDQSKDGSNDRDTGAKGDLEMWRAVEKAMEEGTLNALRYRKDDMPAAPVKKDKKNKQTRGTEHQERPRVVEGNNRRERRAHLAQQEEEDSDGGFFE